MLTCYFCTLVWMKRVLEPEPFHAAILPFCAHCEDNWHKKSPSTAYTHIHRHAIANIPKGNTTFVKFLRDMEEGIHSMAEHNFPQNYFWNTFPKVSLPLAATQISPPLSGLPLPAPCSRPVYFSLVLSLYVCVCVYYRQSSWMLQICNSIRFSTHYNKDRIVEIFNCRILYLIVWWSIYVCVWVCSMIINTYNLIVSLIIVTYSDICENNRKERDVSQDSRVGANYASGTLFTCIISNPLCFSDDELQAQSHC